MTVIELLWQKIPIKRVRHLWSVRLFHWAIVIIIALSASSGLYIATGSKRLGFNSMNRARKVHFFSQYLLGSILISRIYYGCHNYNYRDFIPSKSDLTKGLPNLLKYESFLTHKKPIFVKYNPLQKLLFLTMLVLLKILIATGIMLAMPRHMDKFISRLGGLGKIRQIHHYATLFLLLGISGHVHFVLTESVEKLKSIFVGWYRPQ